MLTSQIEYLLENGGVCVKRQEGYDNRVDKIRYPPNNKKKRGKKGASGLLDLFAYQNCKCQYNSHQQRATEKL